MLGVRHKRKHDDGTRPDLPITPMLDMSFQLMAFFILTFKPAPTEAQLALALPPATGAAASVAPPPADFNAEEDEELKVQVYAAENGTVSKIVAIRPAGEDTLADTSALFKYLKDEAEQKRAKNAKPPKLKLEIAPDLNYQFVVKMVDESRRAGIDSVSPTLIGSGGAAKKP
jgi:biopolymer transport protein ExbD